MSGQSLQALRELLAECGGLIAGLIASPEEQTGRSLHDSPAGLAAAGPRTAGSEDEYRLLIEAIYEGYLLHYDVPRVLRRPEADLAVLAGDRLYAVGLARLVALGDTFAVAELADTITLSALAQGAGDTELADAVWEAGACTVGWGPSDRHRAAKELVAAGSPGALEAMRTSLRAVPAPP